MSKRVEQRQACDLIPSLKISVVVQFTKLRSRDKSLAQREACEPWVPTT
jgi:hypothetical protein